MATTYTYSNGVLVSTHDSGISAPVVFDSADWQEYAYGVLGTLAVPQGTTEQKMLAGIARYGEIITKGRASAAAASDAAGYATAAAIDQYDCAKNFRKDKVAIFLGILNADNKIVKDTELAAVVGSWPNT